MELLVIGAGPYGLAVAAEARRRGLDVVVLGEPMGFWREHMPAGMLLRSGREWHLDAAGVHTFDAFVESASRLRADPGRDVHRVRGLVRRARGASSRAGGA